MDATFIVLYDADAVLELKSLKGRQERDAIFTSSTSFGCSALNSCLRT